MYGVRQPTSEKLSMAIFARLGDSMHRCSTDHMQRFVTIRQLVDHAEAEIWRQGYSGATFLRQTNIRGNCGHFVLWYFLPIAVCHVATTTPN